MATPIENIATLNAYFNWRTSFVPNNFAQSQLYQWTEQMRKGMAAMTELVRDAAGNDHVRKQFAEASIFNTCLVAELASPFSSSFGKGYFGVEIRQPRLIMLDGIRKAAVGGFFTARDPSGLTSWIFSELFGGSMISALLSTDFLPDVLLAMLGLLKNAGVPLIWAQTMTASGGALDQLQAGISTIQWSHNAKELIAIQRNLGKGIDDVRGRYQDVLRLEALKKLETLPVRTGDGNMALTIPPEPKPLYARGEVLLPAIGGLVGGAWLVERRAR